MLLVHPNTQVTNSQSPGSGVLKLTNYSRRQNQLLLTIKFDSGPVDVSDMFLLFILFIRESHNIT